MITTHEWMALGLHPDTHYWLLSTDAYVQREFTVENCNVVVRVRIKYRRDTQDISLGNFATPEQAEQVALTIRLSL